MDFVMYLVLGYNGLVVVIAVLLAVFERETVSTPEQLAATTNRLSGTTRESWDLDRQSLADLLSKSDWWISAIGVAKWRAEFPRPTVGRLTPWWATNGQSDSINSIDLALDVAARREPVVLEEYLDSAYELQPGLLIPVVDLNDGKGFRLALGYPADQLGRLFADYRLERGLLDEHQHAAWVRGQRRIADVVAIRPTGRVLDDSVEVTVDLEVDGEPMNAVGFVRPEEASAMRRSGQVPASTLADRPGEPVLGWFPF